MSEYQRIHYGVHGAIATLTLNRPEKRNALDDLTLRELAEAFELASQEDGIRVIVLRGAGPDFCAGADLDQLERMAATSDPLANMDDAATIGNLLIRMRQLPRPIVAAVHGNVFAGGAGLATACDLVIATNSAKLSYTEVKLGFVPAMVMALLKRVVGEKVAFELTTLGTVIPALEAQRLGLFNRVVADAELDREVQALADELATRSASALQLIKRLLYDTDGFTFDQAVRRGIEVNTLARLTPDCRQGVQQFLAGRKRKS
ncbi:MAG: enoyl-CoA hydratase/isomerase family protein [Longimicrobiales bacterium]